MNRGLPNEWRSFSPLTSNITSHLWDCSKDCPHLHSLHFVTHRKRKKWFISVNVNILKILLTSEEYNKLIGYWLSQSDSAVQDIRSDHLQNHLHQHFSHHWQKIIIVIVWILSQNWCVCLALGLPAVYEMCPHHHHQHRLDNHHDNRHRLNMLLLCFFLVQMFACL